MDIFKDTFYIRSLTDDFIFCPKCGTRNLFRLGKSGTELNYFCERCSDKLNDYWEGAHTGQMEIDMCYTCQQSTFKELKYCVSCGSIQKLVAHKRAKEISRAMGDDQLSEDIRVAIRGEDGILNPGRRVSPLTLLIIIIGLIIVGILFVVIYYGIVGLLW